MKSLLKMYLLDYAQKTLMIMLLIIAGVTLYFYIQNSFSLDFDKFGLALACNSFIWLYMLFNAYGNSPFLANGIWITNLPIPRKELKRLNLQFNIFKQVIILGYYFIIVSCSTIAYWEEISSLKKIKEFSYSSVIEYFSSLTINSTIFSSDSIWLIILVLSLFISVFTVDISTKAIKQNKAIIHNHKEKKRQNKKVYVGVFLGLVIFNIALSFAEGESLFAGGTLMPVMAAFIIFFFVEYLDNFYKIRKINSRKMIPLFLVCIIGSKLYSYYRVSHPDITFSNKLDEIEFQNMFYSYLDVTGTKKILESDISKANIDFIMDTLARKHGRDKVLKHTEYRTLPLYTLYPKELDFEKVIKSKTKIKALQTSLGLFNPRTLTIPQLKIYLDKWYELGRLNETGAYNTFLWSHKSDLLDYLSFRNYSKDELTALLQSENELSRLVGLKLNVTFNLKKKIRKYRSFNRGIIKEVRYDLTDVIYKNIEKYNTDLVYSVSKMFTAASCESVSNYEVFRGIASKEKKIKILDCNLKKQIDRYPKRNKGYLNSQYFYMLNKYRD